MKFKHQPYPANGAKRYRREFLWWPLRLNHETRWLEEAAWTEVYVRPSPVEKGHWVPVAWFEIHQVV